MTLMRVREPWKGSVHSAAGAGVEVALCVALKSLVSMWETRIQLRRLQKVLVASLATCDDI